MQLLALFQFNVRKKLIVAGVVVGRLAVINTMVSLYVQTDAMTIGDDSTSSTLSMSVSLDNVIFDRLSGAVQHPVCSSGLGNLLPVVRMS